MFDDNPKPRWVGPSRSAQVKALKASVQTGHYTGLPSDLLRLFEPGPPVKHLVPLEKKPYKLPLVGVAQYVQAFAAPGDPEYEPPRAPDR